MTPVSWCWKSSAKKPEKHPFLSFASQERPHMAISAEFEGIQKRFNVPDDEIP